MIDSRLGSLRQGTELREKQKMQDKDTELNYYPKVWLSPQGTDRVLCIAPHPDDEVLGCGGMLSLLASQGAHVQSLILTQGEKALGQADHKHAQERRQESMAAAKVMGTQVPQFLDLYDRELCYGEPLVEAILHALQDLPASSSGQAAMLFLPSLSEPHPDHQAAALAGMAAAQRYGQALQVYFYEAGAPLHPNIYCNITSVAAQKWQALACFKTQLGIENYDGLARAMATLRAFGKAPDCTAAEAYFHLDMDALRRNGPLAVLPQWPWVRTHMQLANEPRDLPLVSVLIRSMDRPSLAETLASVALQTYPNIEVVIVNAKGSPHSPVSYMPQHQTVRVITPSNAQALGRSAAANQALDQVQGSLALFLDDDDLIDPDHLQRLVQALHQQSQAIAAYSGVRVVNAQGQTLRQYNNPWSGHRIQGINFLPIHAVLFRMQEVRDRQLQFDPELPVLEDWDFWHRLSQNKTFVHSPGITATYRQSLGQSGLSDPEHDNHWQSWHLQLLTRNLHQSTPQDNAQCLAWHAIELDKTSYQLDQTVQQQQAAMWQLVQTQAELEKYKQQSILHQQARDGLQNELEKYSREVQASMAEKEAKYHAFAAQSNQALGNKEAELQAFAAQSNLALANKEAELHAFAAQSNQALTDSHKELQKLQAWQNKITRKLPGFLLPKKDPA